MSRQRILIAGLVGLAAIALVAFGGAVWLLVRPDAEPGGKTNAAERWSTRWREANEARTQVKGIVKNAISYDYRTLERDLARADEQMTPRFRKVYATNLRPRVSYIASSGDILQVLVLRSGIVSARPGHVVLLLDLGWRTGNAERGLLPGVHRSPTVTLVRQGDRWLLDGLDYHRPGDPPRDRPRDRAAGDPSTWSGPRGRGALEAGGGCMRKIVLSVAGPVPSAKECTTGELRRRALDGSIAEATGIVAWQGPSVRRTTPALISLEGRRASVLVAFDVTVGSGENSGRRYAYEVDLVEQSGTWLVSDIDSAF